MRPGLVGHYLKALASQFDALDAALRVRSGVANSDVLRSYLGLLVQGLSDFDAIEVAEGTSFTKRRWALSWCRRTRRRVRGWTRRRW
jgi:hypothetical protein